MNRILWPLGLLLLVASIVGAGWVLNHQTPHPAAPDREDASSEAAPVVVCLGMVDVESGVAELYPRQFGEVAEIADVQSRDRVFKKGEMLVRLKSQMAEYLVGK